MVVCNNNFKEIVDSINKDLHEKYKFKIDPIYIRRRYIKLNKVYYELIKLNDSESIENDPTIAYYKFNPDVYFTLSQDQRDLLTRISKWINIKIFESSVKLLVAGHINYSTELVRMRIACTMINSITFLKKEEKMEWWDYITDVFYERKRKVLDYYFRDVLELPF